MIKDDSLFAFMPSGNILNSLSLSSLLIFAIPAWSIFFLVKPVFFWFFSNLFWHFFYLFLSMFLVSILNRDHRAITFYFLLFPILCSHHSITLQYFVSLWRLSVLWSMSIFIYLKLRVSISVDVNWKYGRFCIKFSSFDGFPFSIWN